MLNLRNKIFASLVCVATMPLFAGAAKAIDPVEPFLTQCEQKIGQQWQNESLRNFQIPTHFCDHAKGVISFVIDADGTPSRIKIKHSARESLIVAARVHYGERAEGLMNAMDASMIDAIKKSAPLPQPPWQLDSHRKYAVVFDMQRYKPLKVFIDDSIPVAERMRYY